MPLGPAAATLATANTTPRTTRTITFRTQSRRRRHLRRRNQPLPARSEALLQAIFRDAFALPYAHKRLLGDLQNLAAAGDGTPVRTGASPHGKRVWKCKEQGIILPVPAGLFRS